MEARDWDATGATLAENVVVDWPHTGERFQSRENVVGVNRAYPEGWSIEVRRIVADGDAVAAEVAVAEPGGVAHCSGFYQLEAGLIARATEYWTDAGAEEPPAWRRRFAAT